MEIELTDGEKIGIIGAILTFIGSLLPWATWGAFTVSGINGDGMFTLLFSVIAAGLILFRTWDLKNGLATMGLGILSFFIPIYDAQNLTQMASGPLGTTVEAGMGLYLTIIGGVILVVAGLYDLFFEQVED